MTALKALHAGANPARTAYLDTVNVNAWDAARAEFEIAKQNLDYMKNEIREAMATVMQGRTTIVIAHVAGDAVRKALAATLEVMVAAGRRCARQSPVFSL